MPVTTITFVNGEKLTLSEHSMVYFVGPFYTVESESADAEPFVPEEVHSFGPVEFGDYDNKLGLAPDLVNYLHNSDYFYLEQDPNTLYSTSTIFKIESSLDVS